MAKRLWDKGESLHPEILAYTVGNDYVLDLDLVEEDCWGSLAHSRMLADQGLIGREDQGRLAAGLLDVLRQHRAGAFAIAPEEEDVHTAIEGKLVAALGDAGKRLHTGRSRNDQVLVDVRLFAKRRLLDIADAALALATALLDLAVREEETLLPGYTHMRQAMPSSVGLWAAGHAEGLEEDVEALLDAYRACDRCPLGSAAGFGVPVALDRRRTAELLGFERLQVNAQAVQTSRGKAESQALFAASLLAQDLATLAWDAQLYSGSEHGFFVLPGNVATGSSIMPQKRNPDVLELTRANAGVLQAYTQQVLLVAGKLPSSYHRDYQLTKEPLVRGLKLARAMARAMELTVRGLVVDRERAAAAVGPEAYATHHALALVAQGVPFREAYRQVGAAFSGEGTPLPPPEGGLRELYAVEGSAGDLRLDAARARLADLARRAGETRSLFEGRLRTLEEEAAASQVTG